MDSMSMRSFAIMALLVGVSDFAFAGGRTIKAKSTQAAKTESAKSSSLEFNNTKGLWAFGWGLGFKTQPCRYFDGSLTEIEDVFAESGFKYVEDRKGKDGRFMSRKYTIENSGKMIEFMPSEASCVEVRSEIITNMGK